MFKENLKQAMNSRGINQKELAVLMGMAESTVSQYLNGKSTPKIKTVHKLAKVLDVTVDSLITETELQCKEKNTISITEMAKECHTSNYAITKLLIDDKFPFASATLDDDGELIAVIPRIPFYEYLRISKNADGG